MLTKEGDIVLDWTVGFGCTFWVGEYCGNFVIGLEERKDFDEVALSQLMKVFKRKSPNTPIKETIKEKPKSVVEDDDDSDEEIFKSFKPGTGSRNSASTSKKTDDFTE